MRTDLQLLQSALSSTNLKRESIERINTNESTLIRIYLVELPEKFKGIPFFWHFGILSEQANIEDEFAIYEEAENLIRILIKLKEIPIVFISDDSRISFNDQIEFKNSPVFFLSKLELPGREHFVDVASDAPIILSARRKFKNPETSYYLSPYSPNKPVYEWKFFGRKKEIRDILESPSNCILIGSRRIGKTSILKEVRHQLELKGEKVYWIQAQYMEKVSDVIAELAKNLSARDYHRAQRSGKFVDLNFTIGVLKKIKGSHKNITLIFDEIGNTIVRDKSADSWKFIGALRELSHNYSIKIIISAFQEILIKQITNFEGPFVNFGSIIRVNSFTKNEIEELLVLPLNFWGKIRDKNNFTKKVMIMFGSHPLILQFLGKKLFELIIINEEKFIDKVLEDLIEDDGLAYFESAITDIFWKIGSYLERYIFFQLCINIRSQKQDLVLAKITEEIVRSLLIKIGIESDLDSRVILLDRLTLRGLLSQDIANKSIYRIDCPIVFNYYYKYHYPIQQLTNSLRNEIKLNKLTINEIY